MKTSTPGAARRPAARAARARHSARLQCGLPKATTSSAVVFGGRQLVSGLAEVLQTNLDGAAGRPAAEGGGEGGRLGGDADDVKEGDRAGGGRGGGHRLELVLRRRGVQAVDDGDLVVDQGAEQVAEDRVEVVAGDESGGEIAQADEDLAQAWLVEVETGGGNAAGQGAADVEVVAVAVGAGADHGVGEGDGVRFGPGDLLAEAGAGVGLVGGAGEGGQGAHAEVGLTEAGGAVGVGGGRPQLAPAVVIERDDVERGRHPHPPAERGQPLGEFEAGFALVDAAVDVGAGDRQQ